jgi:hypothetical protein
MVAAILRYTPFGGTYTAIGRSRSQVKAKRVIEEDQKPNVRSVIDLQPYVNEEAVVRKTVLSGILLSVMRSGVFI